MRKYLKPSSFKASLDGTYFRTAVLATLAVVFAYLIGLNSNLIAADIAAIWALINVRATFHQAVRESVVQVSATILGGLIGFLAVQAYGFSIPLMAGLVLFSFAIGYLLRLGIDGSTIIGFTIIAVTSNSFSLETTEARIGGVLTGTLIAAALSLFVKRGTPQSRMRRRIVELRESKHDVLVSLSEVVAETPLNIEAIFRLKVQSKALLEDISNLVAETKELIRGSKWSPLTKKHEAEELNRIADEVMLDAIIIVDMVESMDTLRSDLPAGYAQRTQKSIARAARAIKEDYYDTDTQVIYLVEAEDITPTQILITNDLLAASEKLKKRKRRGSSDKG